MAAESIIGFTIFLITGLFTYQGFRDRAFFDDYSFDVDGILVHKEYRRMITSGLLHANWIHFGFNMIALLSFSNPVEYTLGTAQLALIYIASLLGGSLLSLYIHRHHGDYRAIGASGAVSGVVLASVVLYPEGTIRFVILPIEFESWVFALLFVAYTIFGIKSQHGNIGHDAHLGGALTGVLLVVVLEPELAFANLWIVLLILIPAVVFLVLIIRNPAVLMVDDYWGEHIRDLSKVARKPPTPKQAKKKVPLDVLLDKIKREGIDSLTESERRQLEDYKNEL